jgi:hypothetical protein
MRGDAPFVRDAVRELRMQMTRRRMVRRITNESPALRRRGP